MDGPMLRPANREKSCTIQMLIGQRDILCSFYDSDYTSAGDCGIYIHGRLELEVSTMNFDDWQLHSVHGALFWNQRFFCSLPGGFIRTLSEGRYCALAVTLAIICTYGFSCNSENGRIQLAYAVSEPCSFARPASSTAFTKICYA